MKHVKKLVILLLALILVLNLGITVFAAENYTITISKTDNNDGTDHTYDAYQIFTGNIGNHDASDSTDGTNAMLGNVEWGASVTNAKSLDSASAIAERLAVDYEGTDKITTDALLGMINLSSEAFATSNKQSNGDYVISNLPAGYYLVKDRNTSLVGKEDAYTEFILEVVENSVVNPKASAPTLEKKVKDINDSTGEASEWQDSADYDIGDDVPFQLTATLASNVSSYVTYSVKFVDTMSEGLTFNNDVKVFLDSETVTEVTDKFTVATEKGDNNSTIITIFCDDVKAFGAGNQSKIVAIFSAKLNDKAAIGAAGNPNIAYLNFSNNPANSGTPNPENPDEPGTPPANPENGKTPDDKVVVFTYQAVVNKKDDQGKELTGAVFTLYKKKKDTNNAYVAVTSAAVNDAETTFTFKGLDDGDYKLVETTTPPGYNTVDPIFFTITAEHDEEETDPKLENVTGAAANDSEEAFIFEFNAETGSLTVDVINQSGTVLPETGGMGTTLIYVIGGILVLAAVVLLVTKKRMSSAE